MDEIKIAERLAKLEQDQKSVHRRLDNLDRLTVSIHSIATEIKAMREDLNNIVARLDEIEHRPQKRLDVVITSSITAVIGAVIGYFLK